MIHPGTAVRRPVAAFAAALCVAAALAACGSSSPGPIPSTVTTAAASPPGQGTATPSSPGSPAPTYTNGGGAGAVRTPTVTSQAPLSPSAGHPVLAASYTEYNTMTQTKYDYSYTIDPATGVYFYDCVGFVSEALKQTSPAAYAQVATAAGVDAHHVPKPAGYQQFFATLDTSAAAGWQQVPTVAGIQPGDIVAEPYPPGHSSDGHIVIAAGAPQAVGNNQYALAVMDSTQDPHGPLDTRLTNPHNLPENGTAKPSGLGIGTMVFGADAQSGAPVSMAWSVGATPSPLTIGIGRWNG